MLFGSSKSAPFQVLQVQEEVADLEPEGVLIKGVVVVDVLEEAEMEAEAEAEMEAEAEVGVEVAGA